MKEDIEFVSPSLSGERPLLFRRVTGHAALGRLPDHRIELLRLSELDPIEGADLLGKQAGLRVMLTDRTLREINGQVTSFEQCGAWGEYDVYRVELRPWLWQLTLGADCRIFQDMSVVEIIKKVFDGYQPSRFESRLSGSYGKRPFTVQYRETHYDFVARLMEDEGIYHYFDYKNGNDTLILCDGPKGHDDMPGGEIAYAANDEATHLRHDVINDWVRSKSLGSRKYTHTDFAAEKPTTELTASAVRQLKYPKPNELEIFDYPGGHDDHAMGTNTGGKVAAGERAAKLRIDEMESRHDVAEALTTHRTLAVGQTFTFEGHPDKGGYLVTETVVDAEYRGYDDGAGAEIGTTYNCQLVAVPKAVAFQPPRVIARPSIGGPQTATVVGPKSDEIFTDKYGRVKLLFHWDRHARKEKLQEKSSCWVRVSQPWASKQFGAIALPRVGDEVVVEFLEGNPDRPLVTGRVYNGDNLPPWEPDKHPTISGIKTRSSKGGNADTANELRFEDAKGKEYIWLQAEKDYHRLVKNDDFDRVMRNRSVEIENDALTKIDGNVDTSIGKAVKLKVGSDVHVDLGADLLTNVGGALGFATAGAIDVKGDATFALKSDGAMSIATGGKLAVGAQAAVHVKAGADVVIEGAMKLTIKVGGSSVVLGPEGVSITGPIVKINSGGAAGSASAAAQARPATPKSPEELKEDKDPLVG